MLSSVAFTGSSSSSFWKKLGKYDRPVAKSNNDSWTKGTFTKADGKQSADYIRVLFKKHWKETGTAVTIRQTDLSLMAITIKSS